MMLPKWHVIVDGVEKVFTTNDPKIIGLMADLNAQHEHSLEKTARPYQPPQEIRVLGIA